ncbi:hypothetical protein DWB68_05360 [Galactobacter valiniphilus]|uniref:FtsK domain-containing protein n=1 Tax=Galactobacter valiniphilus TaxID=2676122 RepID=A0A399JJX6_9MICC|nr:hypothetical protein DWB68_05360 [Galactobacter valiniphilus]
MDLRLSWSRPAQGRRGTAGRRDERGFVVEVDEATTLGELGEALNLDPLVLVDPAAVERSEHGWLLTGDPARRAEAAALPLRGSGLLSGAELPPASEDRMLPGTARLEWVGGPFAGTTVRLQEHQTQTLGHAAEASVRIADPFLRPVHATLTLLPPPEDGRPGPRMELVPATSQGEGRANVSVNGEPIHGRVEVGPKDLVQLGSTILRVGRVPASDADLSGDEPGSLGFNRPSRIRPSTPVPGVLLPGDRPDDPDKTPLPWLSALMPIVLGVTMAIVFQRYVMLLMAAASPIMVIGSFMVNRRLAKRKGQRSEAEWVQDVEDARERIATLVRKQRAEAWVHHPDPVTLSDIATAPLSRLWERRFDDADARLVRVGVGEADLRVAWEGGSQRDRVAERSVGVSPSPVLVDLGEGPVGIAGRVDAVLSTARSMLTQLATLRSPRDLRIVVLCEDSAVDEWSWVQWLPHAQGAAGPVVEIGNSEDTRRERLREISSRVEAVAQSGPRGTLLEDEILLVVAGARRYRTLPGMVGILARGGAAGVRVVALDESRSRLPEECRSVVIIDERDASLATVHTQAKHFPCVLLDGVSLASAQKTARALAPLRHVSGEGDESLIPSSVRFVELMDVNLQDPAALVGRWAHQPRQSYVVVGATADGEFALDIAKDGPHALVAGTTGSGKSEFLQTLVMALAMANRPEALNFVLVDYKGGSAFADCERLPHTVGMVTNLDAQETERALASLEAELRRREEILRDMGAKDVDAAWAKDARGAADRGLARLVLVIDEFAELKTELPEFIDGLVRIARVGRSLGVNLVLATQRPSGVITPEMQSNVNLRVALRVTDRSDSVDVLGTPDAAFISASTPGRGLVRLSAGAAPQAFQAARVAGLRAGAHRAKRQLPPVAELSWDSLGYAAAFPPKTSAGSGPKDHDDTDLRALVDLTLAAAQAAQARRNPSPWLPPLPAEVTLTAIPEQPGSAVAVGLEDIPAQQRQRAFTYDLANDSHLLFIGGARSGRTTALRSLLGQLISRFDRRDLQVYALDFGTGALLSLADAPQTGAVVRGLEVQRVQRLVTRLSEELTRRQQVLSASAAGDIAEQRRRASVGEGLPYVVVALDGWERLVAAVDADRMMALRDDMLRLLREGPAVGMRVLVTGDKGVLTDKLSAFVDEQLVLPLRDVSDYRSAGIMLKSLPVELPPGRILRRGNSTTVQWGMLSPDGHDEAGAFMAAVRRAATSGTAVPGGVPAPFHVDALPGSISLERALGLPAAALGDPAGPVVAVGGDTLSGFRLAWPLDGGFSVAGGRGTGRSSALSMLLAQLHAEGDHRLVVVGSKPSPFTRTAEELGVPWISSTDTDASTMMGLLPPEGAVTVLVDDAELLKGTPLEQALMGIKFRAQFIAAADLDAAPNLFSGPFAEAKRSRLGLVLSPSTAVSGAQIYGQSIPRTLLGRRTPGGGVLAWHGAWIEARVPAL